MNDFANMTPDELQASMQADIYRVLIRAETTAGGKDALTAYLGDMTQHIEVIAHPPTEADRAMRLSGRTEMRPKTAWGWMEMLRIQAEGVEAREPVTVTLTL